MRLKINIAIYLLYIAGFANFTMEMLGIGKTLDSFVSLFLDIGILYIGFSTIGKSKLNVSILAIVVTLTLLNYLSHNYALLSCINGLRELLIIFMAFSFYEQLSHLKVKQRFIIRIERFSKTFLISQFPITIFQFLLYGASDKVGGSLGAGNSGVLTLVTIPMVYLLIKHKRAKIGVKAYYNLLYLLPIFLNETKISFILLPVMFLCLTDFKKKAGAIFLSLGLGIFVFMSLNSLYTDQGQKSANPIKEMFNSEFLEFYLLSDVDEGVDVPRFTKIITAVNLLNEHSVDFILGKETGAFKGGKVIQLSAFAKNYEWLLLGSRPYLFYLLISGGWSLLAIIVFYAVHKIFAKRRPDADKQFLFLLFFIFICILFYNDAFRNQFFVLIFSYFILLGKGYFTTKKKMNHQKHKEEIMSNSVASVY